MNGIADYRFIRELGSGSHGTYYVARPPARLGIRADVVAVKVIQGRTTHEGLRRLTAELRAFVAAQSDHLVHPLDAGQESERFFYATEYYPDGSLYSPARPLSRSEKMRVVADAARGAHALHESGVAHRSIKPRNVLLDGDRGKLTDLGLAHALQPGQTVSRLGPVDAVEFLDPSVLTGQRPSRASDIWSLSATLHYTLSGEGLYKILDERDQLAAVRAVLTKTPRISPRLEPEDAALVERGLNAGRSEAFASAQALADALEDAAGRLDVETRA